MKISIQFTANLVLENVEIADDKAKEIMSYFEKNGTLTEEHLDMIMNDQSADLYVEDVLEISDVCEFTEEGFEDDASDN
jgi:hypothetical protein